MCKIEWIIYLKVYIKCNFTCIIIKIISNSVYILMIYLLTYYSLLTVYLYYFS